MAIFAVHYTYGPAKAAVAGNEREVSEGEQVHGRSRAGTVWAQVSRTRHRANGLSTWTSIRLLAGCPAGETRRPN